MASVNFVQVYRQAHDAALSFPRSRAAAGASGLSKEMAAIEAHPDGSRLHSTSISSLRRHVVSFCIAAEFTQLQSDVSHRLAKLAVLLMSCALHIRHERRQSSTWPDLFQCFLQLVNWTGLANSRTAREALSEHLNAVSVERANLEKQHLTQAFRRLLRFWQFAMGAWVPSALIRVWRSDISRSNHRIVQGKNRVHAHDARLNCDTVKTIQNRAQEGEEFSRLLAATMLANWSDLLTWSRFFAVTLPRTNTGVRPYNRSKLLEDNKAIQFAFMTLSSQVCPDVAIDMQQCINKSEQNSGKPEFDMTKFHEWNDAILYCFKGVEAHYR